MRLLDTLETGDTSARGGRQARAQTSDGGTTSATCVAMWSSPTGIWRGSDDPDSHKLVPSVGSRCYVARNVSSIHAGDPHLTCRRSLLRRDYCQHGMVRTAADRPPPSIIAIVSVNSASDWLVPHCGDSNRGPLTLTVISPCGEVFSDDLYLIRAMSSVFCSCTLVFPAIYLVGGDLFYHKCPQSTWGGENSSNCHHRRPRGAPPAAGGHPSPPPPARWPRLRVPARSAAGCDQAASSGGGKERDHVHGLPPRGGRGGGRAGRVRGVGGGGGKPRRYGRCGDVGRRRGL